MLKNFYKSLKLILRDFYETLKFIIKALSQKLIKLKYFKYFVLIFVILVTVNSIRNYQQKHNYTFLKDSDSQIVNLKEFENVAIFVWDLNAQDSITNLHTLSELKKMLSSLGIKLIVVHKNAKELVNIVRTYSIYTKVDLNDLYFNLNPIFINDCKFPTLLIYKNNKLILKKEGYVDWFMKKNVEELRNELKK